MNDISILLIDDDQDDREVFLDIVKLLSKNVKCITASNGEEAFQKLLKENLRPNVIFLDLNMPLMNGLQFMKEFRKHNSINAIPIYVCSTSSSPDNIEDSKKLGAKGYLVKPGKVTEWQLFIAKTIATISDGDAQ